MIKDIEIKRRIDFGTVYRLIKTVGLIGLFVYCLVTFGLDGATNTGLMMIGSLFVFSFLAFIFNVRKILNRSLLKLTSQGIYNLAAKGQLKHVMISYDVVQTSMWIKNRRKTYLILVVPDEISEQFYIDYEKFSELSTQNFLSGNDEEKQARIDLAKQSVIINFTNVSSKNKELINNILNQHHIMILPN